jgi:hypothetical protein
MTSLRMPPPRADFQVVAARHRTGRKRVCPTLNQTYNCSIDSRKENLSAHERIQNLSAESARVPLA